MGKSEPLTSDQESEPQDYSSGREYSEKDQTLNT